MAYRLKTIRYRDSDVRILLQNENGPCPLLATANALLLKKLISLPAHCIRNNVASLDDVTNMLANQAILSRSSAEKDQPDEQFLLDELMKQIPDFQYGMDVNLKFTEGPTGYEYTRQLTALDLWNVKLVHGWLLNHDDEEVFLAVGNKTYNELVEKVIHGKDAAADLDHVSKQITELRERQRQQQELDETWDMVERNDAKENTGNGNGNGNGTDGSGDGNGTADGSGDGSGAANGSGDGSGAADAAVAAAAADNDGGEAKRESTTPASSPTRVATIDDQELAQLQEKHDQLSEAAAQGAVIDNFLQSTSHQLTHSGLQALYEYLKEDEICIFFRNNHFATMTKHAAELYLLVTDLGYANTPDICWEKLDVIDGDTEYVNSLFSHPARPKDANATTAGSTLTPEQLLAQQGQNEADYQMALQLSQQQQQPQQGTAAGPGAGGPAPTRAELDAREGQLMAVATEASLRQYHGLGDGIQPQPQTTAGAANANAGVAAVGVPTQPVPAAAAAPAVGGGTVAAIPPAFHGGQEPPVAASRDPAMSQFDADRLLAMELQNQDEASLRLARELQEQENRAARQQQQGRATTGAAGGRTGQPAQRATVSTASGCVIS